MSGKKADLIERIIENTTPEERTAICPDLYYVLTERGLKVDEEYIKGQKEKNIQLKATIIEKIKARQYELSYIEMAKAYQKEPIPPGSGIDWNDIDCVRNLARKEQVRLRTFDFSDLNNTELYKEFLFQVLYYDVQIEHNLFASITAISPPNEEKISCPALETFFEKKAFSPTEVKKVFTYLVTKRFNHLQLSMRETLRNDKYTPLPNGEFNISDDTISLWKAMKEFEELAKLEIPGFPKTFQTFQKHKEKNDEKYQFWLNFGM